MMDNKLACPACRDTGYDSSGQRCELCGYDDLKVEWYVSHVIAALIGAVVATIGCLIYL